MNSTLSKYSPKVFSLARVERSHQTISNLGKAMLIASNLPSTYFTDAERVAVYISNRSVHSNKKVSAFEAIYGKQPNILKLMPFGYICYAQVPIEVRGKGKKLEDSGLRCRLIGYGDDTGTEQRQVYKLLSEKDHTVFYSLDVIFKPELQMESLPLLKAKKFEPDFYIPEDDESVIIGGRREDSLRTRDSRIDNAIAQGHIETTRGSADCHLDLIEFHVKISVINSLDILKCFSAAMNG